MIATAYLEGYMNKEAVYLNRNTFPGAGKVPRALDNNLKYNRSSFLNKASRPNIPSLRTGTSGVLNPKNLIQRAGSFNNTVNRGATVPPAKSFFDSRIKKPFNGFKLSNNSFFGNSNKFKTSSNNLNDAVNKANPKLNAFKTLQSTL